MWCVNASATTYKFSLFFKMCDIIDIKSLWSIIHSPINWYFSVEC